MGKPNNHVTCVTEESHAHTRKHTYTDTHTLHRSNRNCHKYSLNSHVTTNWVPMTSNNTILTWTSDHAVGTWQCVAGMAGTHHLTLEPVNLLNTDSHQNRQPTKHLCLAASLLQWTAVPYNNVQSPLFCNIDSTCVCVCVFVYVSVWHRESRTVNSNSGRFFRGLNPEWRLFLLRHV